jgi:hypothetical protein
MWEMGAKMIDVIMQKNYRRLVESAAELQKIAKETCNEDITFKDALMCVSYEQLVGEYTMLLQNDVVQAISDMTDCMTEGMEAMTAGMAESLKDVASEIYHCCT